MPGQSFKLIRDLNIFKNETIQILKESMAEFLCNIKEEKFLLAKLLYFKNPKAVKENIDKIGNIEIDFYFHKNHHMEKKTTNDRKKMFASSITVG